MLPRAALIYDMMARGVTLGIAVLPSYTGIRKDFLQ